MTTEQFVNKYNGKGINFDGAYGNQCIDLAAQFVQEVWGHSGWDIAKGAAYQVWTEFDSLPASKYAHRVPNTPTGVPPEGALMVWGTGIGQYGHISVVRGGSNTSVFQSFDQNWNYHQYCEPIVHNYNAVLGWIVLNEVAKPQEVDMIDANGVKDLYRVFLGREASQGEANSWANIPWTQAFYGIKDSAEGKAYAAKEAATVVAVSELTKQVNDLKQNPSKADLQAALDKLKVESDKVQSLQAQLDKGVSDDQAAGVVVDKVNPVVKFIQLVISKLKGGK